MQQQHEITNFQLPDINNPLPFEDLCKYFEHILNASRVKHTAEELYEFVKIYIHGIYYVQQYHMLHGLNISAMSVQFLGALSTNIAKVFKRTDLFAAFDLQVATRYDEEKNQAIGYVLSLFITMWKPGVHVRISEHVSEGHPPTLLISFSPFLPETTMSEDEMVDITVDIVDDEDTVDTDKPEDPPAGDIPADAEPVYVEPDVGDEDIPE